MSYLGDFPVDGIVYIPFHTFNSSGASVTLTGLAVTDIEIYKDGSTTQRASEAGYTLLDTDGIDFDGITGIHGFKVDLSDNTDAGFFAAGHEYMVVVASVTVDSQTVNFVAAEFSIERAGGVLALLKNGTYGLSAIESLVDDIGAAGAGLTAIPWNAAWDAEVQSEATDALNAYDPPTNAEMEARTIAAASYATPTNITAGTITTVTNLTNAPTAGDLTATMKASVNAEVDTALNTAIPGSPTSDSINQRIAAIDDLTQASGAGDLAAILTDTGTTLDDLVDDLESRLTATRAGYLDNLSAGAVATAASVAALNNISTAQVNAEVVDVLRTDLIPDSYAADGAQPTIAQAILAIQQYLFERAVSSTTVTVRKPDGSTSAMTLTLDSATAPTSITRAT